MKLSIPKCFAVVLLVYSFTAIGCSAPKTGMPDEDIVKRWSWKRDKETVSAKILEENGLKTLYVKTKYEDDSTNPDSHTPVSSDPNSFNYRFYQILLTTMSEKLCETASEGKDFSQVKCVVEDGKSNRMIATGKLSDYRLFTEKQISKEDFDQRLGFTYESP